MKRPLLTTIAMIWCALSFSQVHASFMSQYTPSDPWWDQSELQGRIIYRNVNTIDYNTTYFGFKDYSVYSGYYLGTILNVESGDSEFVKAVNDYVLAFAGECIDIENKPIYKAEDENNWYYEGLTVTFDGNEYDDDYGQSGSWGFDDPAQGFGFYAVKGGKEMALYFVCPPQNSGNWTMMHVLNPAGKLPAISHMTGIDPPLTTVPEPSAMLLLGFGLLGLGFAARRR